MYMFNMDRRYKRPIVAPIVSPIQIKHVHSSVAYQPIKDMIAVVLNCLVGMGLYTPPPPGYGLNELGGQHRVAVKASAS